ncbi:non-muscle caldesmon [Chanos chanos]|uniref:Non-muscle caldesmon n=1 Tax=Chanos chanos TaxID=29144 RepID=A0A6J2WQ44_CHACN|nr:non-muscle caldesmon-like [Chanos chanos]
MSSAVLRRSSSKQGLQNLLRVTAQRSIEDAEEIERERRRRAREAFRKENSLSDAAGSLQDTASPSEFRHYESESKPSSSPAVEEDEGFSDWTQRLDRGKRLRQENGHAEEEREIAGAAKREENVRSVVTTPVRPQRSSEKEEGEEEVDNQPARRLSERRREFGARDREVNEWRDEEARGIRRREEVKRPEAEEKMKDKRTEVKVSYMSKVVLQQDKMPPTTSEDKAVEEMTSHLTKLKKAPRVATGLAPEMREDVEVCHETEQKLEKIRRSHQEKESQELEQLRQRQAEAEVELEELKKRREERRKIREEEERRREEEEQQRLAKEEDEKKRMKEDIERRRTEAAERRLKSLNTTCSKGDETFNPLSPKSPTFKITERTESLNRSLKKSNSFKKTQPPMLLSKIDDKLEQYTHAIESSSKEVKATKSAVVDMPSVPEPVATKKSLFEAGEAWNQNTTKGTPSKDTEGMKVGVADLITHWVKGSPEGGSRSSPSRPSDVKSGDVLQKKNMWEIIGEVSSTQRSTSGAKGTPSGKRYKFVVTGHGKYEKIAADNEDGSGYSNGKSNLCHDDL